ncbi:MAG: hypothetical protein ABFS46_21205, partial [Myxococcota bacterium]
FGDYAEDYNGNANPCYLEDGVTPATCLDFYSTGNQIACWTQFDGDSASINTSDLTGIIHDGNPVEVSSGQSFYVDNGVKTPVIDDIADRFYGDGDWDNDPSGSDNDLDGKSDSWVVGLPVIECQQDGDECAKGDPAKLMGVVCFEIQEVIVTPDKRIKGRFLCKDDVKFKDCDLKGTGTGGSDFDVRADFPVLVR